MIAIMVSLGFVVGAAWYLPIQKASAPNHPVTQAQTDDAQAFAVHGDVELPTSPTGEPLSVAVIGDSVGQDMYAALAGYGSGNVNAIDVAEGGCGIFDADSAVSAEGDVMDTQTFCWPWKDKLRAANAAHSPDVYILHNLWDANDQLINGEWVSPGTPKWEARYESQLELLVAIGAETAKEQEPLILLSNDRAREDSESPSRERLDAVNAVSARMAEKYPNVKLLDFEGATCPSDACLTQDAQGQEIYRDGAHFPEAGLSLMAPWLEEQISEGLTDIK